MPTRPYPAWGASGGAAVAVWATTASRDGVVREKHPRPRMLKTLHRNKFRIGLVLLVFLIFVLNATGVLDLRLHLGSDISIRGGALAALLQSRHLPALMRSPEFPLFMGVGLVLSLLLPVLSPIKASMLTLACLSITMYLAYALPTMGRMIPLEYILLTILMLFVVNVLAAYFAETHSKQKLLDVFGYYLPPELVAALSKQPESISLEGEARELSVLFCDIKGFTEISEKLDPRRLTRLLNIYFTAMTNILHEHGATIDKYIGDAIMAFWNAPLDQPDHALRAVRAALAMQRETTKLRQVFEEAELPPICISIGINTGTMSVGNMGSQFRIAYTVVGDAVNLASRIEHLTRTYETGVVVTEATCRATPGILFRELDLVKVKGKDRMTRIFEPLLPADEADEGLVRQVEINRAALEAYYQEDWERAGGLFEQLRDQGANAVYCRLFLDRITLYASTPPPSGWKGETAFTVT
jgi:adenylate cyclase